jgi:hypothetical protein
MPLCVIFAGCSAKDNRLYGKWRSDRDLSVQWNKTHLNLTTNELIAIQRNTGHFSIEFSPKGKGVMELKSFEKFNGTNNVSVKGYIEPMRYEVIKSEHNMFYINIKSDSYTWFPCVHLESNNVAWIVGAGDVEIAREFFRRSVGDASGPQPLTNDICRVRSDAATTTNRPSSH